MKTILQYIKESYDEIWDLSKEEIQQLLDLDLEYGKLMLISRYETVAREILNGDEEWEKFEQIHIINGQKYFPVIKHKELKYEKYDLENRTNKLIDKFRQIRCPLKKYYIENLDSILSKIDYIKNLEGNDYEIAAKKISNFEQSTIDYALDVIHNTKDTSMPKDKIYKRDITGDKVKEKIQQALDELGYDWKIIENNDMPPRMGVNPEKTFRIRTTAKFSEVDIESLIAHEIKGHVRKRYEGYKKGLFLFVFGLPGKNIFDEGMAIWNSLNLTVHQKPYALFKICFSYIVCYYLAQYDFCEAFDRIKLLCEGKHVSDKLIFKQMMRSKRSTIRTDRLGYWSGDIDYLRGYLLINQMTTEEREKIIKWNIGPDQYYNIEAFEKFFEYNDIPEISNKRLNEIKKDYKDLPK
jgi:hypothetical protein